MVRQFYDNITSLTALIQRTKYATEDFEALSDQFAPFKHPQFGCIPETGEYYPGVPASIPCGTHK